MMKLIEILKRRKKTKKEENMEKQNQDYYSKCFGIVMDELKTENGIRQGQETDSTELRMAMASLFLILGK